jgi:uncharacterized membrane protein YcaP (DUF421 family)
VGLLFNSWFDLGRVLILGVLGYVSLVFLLRVSGNRTLSKLNAFDFVVTIALGSTYGSLVLNKNVSISEGVLAFATLVGLQYIIAWLTVRSDTIRKLTKNEPTLLYYNGEFLKDALTHARVAKGEIEQSVRNHGYASMKQVEAVVLETDGSFSIISKSEKEEKKFGIVGLKV